MTVFFVQGFSANSVVYLNKTISASDFAALSFTNSSVRYSYTDLSTQPHISLFGSVANQNYRVSYDNLPYSADGYISGSSLFWEGVIFTSSQSLDRRIVFSLSPIVNLYFDDFDLDLYFLFPGTYFSINFQYLDDTFYSITADSYRLAYDFLPNLKVSYPDIISQSFVDYVTDNHYYTSSSGNNSTYNLIGNTKFYLYKYTLHFTGLDKTHIQSILINYTYSQLASNPEFPRIFPFINFGSDINCYIKSSQDEVYTQQLALAQQQNQMLEDITGDVPSGMQSELDTDQAVQDHKLEELNENLDIINEPTMPPEEQLPTAPIDNEDLDEVSQDIEAVFNLDILNLFNILVPTGCAGFLIYTVMRRF